MLYTMILVNVMAILLFAILSIDILERRPDWGNKIGLLFFSINILFIIANAFIMRYYIRN